MNKQELLALATYFVEKSEDNRINEQIALADSVVGMRIFEAPLLACVVADDELFLRLKEPNVIGEHFILPLEWLPQAKTVISFFLPFTEVVKKGNSRDFLWPSEEWLHARIEGQKFLVELSRYLQNELSKAGFRTLIPAMDERFWSKSDSDTGLAFTSNWSERHIAYVCGLGTFGLSKGLITKKGLAGRFISIITELALPSDPREYQGIYEYCTMCGACVRNCPVEAISLAEGKNHKLCSDFLARTMEKYRPRYGCGKCQIRVPCEGEIPKKAKF